MGQLLLHLLLLLKLRSLSVLLLKGQLSKLLLLLTLLLTLLRPCRSSHPRQSLVSVDHLEAVCDPAVSLRRRDPFVLL